MPTFVKNSGRKIEETIILSKKLLSISENKLTKAEPIAKNTSSSEKVSIEME